MNVLRAFFFGLLVLAGVVAILLFFLSARPAEAATAFADLATHAAEQPAINRMVAQGIMRGVSGTRFNPDAATTRGELAVSVQHMFNLEKASAAPSFTDIPTSSPLYAAVEAVAPYLRRQALCFGCALGTTFGPNEPVTRAQSAVLLTGVLVAKGKLTLLDKEAADDALAHVADAQGLSPAARTYLATALKSGLVDFLPGNAIKPNAPRTRAQIATVLDSIQTKFAIPSVQP